MEYLPPHSNFQLLSRAVYLRAPRKPLPAVASAVLGLLSSIRKHGEDALRAAQLQRIAAMLPRGLEVHDTLDAAHEPIQVTIRLDTATRHSSSGFRK